MLRALWLLPLLLGLTGDLAVRLGLPPDQVTVAQARDVVFPDAALGLPRPGEAAAAVSTPGTAAVLKAGEGRYLYTAGGGSFRYGGPVQSWQYSALWVAPVGGDPNLNGTLMQVSLAGTNPTRLLESVSDFRPQPDGSVLAWRRTSRSGHDLLWLARGQATRVTSAVAFAEAVVDPTGTRWAAVLRPRLGGGWVLAREGQAQELPPGSPTGLAWTRRDPVVRVGAQWFAPVGGGWREVQGSGADDPRLLNKSETLVVEPDGDGTRVVRRWFTGEERLLARIPDFAARDVFVAPGRDFALLSTAGEARAVDLHTGEVLPVLPGPARLLLAPPETWPAVEALFRR